MPARYPTANHDTVELNHVEPPIIQQAPPLSRDTTTNVAGAEPVDETLEQSRFLQHMATYPAVAALTGVAASFPAVKIFASNAVPLLMAMRNRDDKVSKRAYSALDRADVLGDQVLDRIDARFPQLKSTQPDDLVRPVRDAGAAATVYGTAAQDALSSRLVRPAKQAVRSVRKQYNTRIYDTQGKALIRSQFDPIVGPLNDRLEGVIVDYIPGTGEMGKPDVSNQLSRTWRLGRSAIRRGVPAARDQAAYLSEFPNAATGRVREIYNDRRQTHSEGNRGAALAAMGTGRQVVTEGIQYLRQVQRDTQANRAANSSGIDERIEKAVYHPSSYSAPPEMKHDYDEENYDTGTGNDYPAEHNQPPVSIVDNVGDAEQ